MLTTERDDSCVDHSSFFIYGEVGSARSDIEDDDTELLLSAREGRFSDSEYVRVDISDLDTDVEDSLTDIR